MRHIKIPELDFGPWHAWEKRRDIASSHMPGVYLLANTRKNLRGASAGWGDVSYIRMTNSRQGLRGRWQQFYNSVRGKNGHSGGNTVLLDLGHYEGWTQNLFVAAIPIECDVVHATERDLIRMGWVAYLEYEAFAAFHRQFPKQG